MNIILTSVEPELADAWERFCGDLAFVTVHRGSIFDLSCDAVVSPANSFGFMDGGIDMLYTQYFGWQVQERLQEAIRERHHGELLVGQAEIVETDNPDLPFLIAAPTMRVPMILRDSVTPTSPPAPRCCWSSMARFAGGTYAGRRSRTSWTASRFLALAPVSGVSARTPAPTKSGRRSRMSCFSRDDFPVSWADAQTRHQQLYTDRVRDLQQE